jgi:microcystin-dependent protein/nicotinamide mononucleotide (NMN) deamidase PncC
MSDSPTGKAYLGLAYNKTTSSESSVYADYSWSLIEGPQGPPGNTGIQGPPGADGSPTYTWVKYATNSTGTTGFSDSPAGATYIGLAFNKTTATESSTPGDYAWSLIQGPTGSQGIQGPAGADGTPRYMWLKYADSPTTGMSDSPSGKTYMGVAYNKTTATESSTYGDYDWSLIQGPTGNTGIQGPPGADGTTTYTWVKYATNSTGTTGFSDSPAGATYIGLAFNKTTATESSTPGDYAWSLIQGATGSQGIQGPPGADGTPRYMWLKYADTPTTGMSDSPAGKTYMGVAYNKTTATESSTYGDYDWSLIQGPQGDQGVPGTPGADGTPRYSWIKYADSAAGAGMSDSPVGKTYIGIAYNKTTATESSTAGDYEWALIQGEGTVYRQATAPTGLTAGDKATWYDTDNDNLQHYWDGDTWEPFPLGAGATEEGLLAGKKVPIDTGMSLEWAVPNPSYALASGTLYRAAWEQIAEIDYSTQTGAGMILHGGVWYTTETDFHPSNGMNTHVVGSDGSRRLVSYESAGVFGSRSDITKIGTTWYVMVVAAQTNPKTRILRFNESWELLSTSTIFTSGYTGQGLTNDGTSLLLVSRDTSVSTAWRVETRNATTMAVTATNNITHADFGTNTPLAFMYGSFDFGAARIAVLTSGSSNSTKIYSFTTAGVAQTGEHFDVLATGASPIAPCPRFGWDGTRWVADTKYYGIRRSTANATTGKVWASYTYFDSVGGSLETAAAPVSTIGVDVPARHGLEIYSMAPPEVNETPAPDVARFYFGTSATAPALSTLRRATALPVVTVDQYGTISNFTALPFSRTADAPPVASTFPAGAAGFLSSELGGFIVKGDGTGDWPYLRDMIETDLGADYATVGHRHDDYLTAMRSANYVGKVEMWYGAKTECPAGMLVMDGSTFSSSTYPELFAHLGSTTLPNMEDRVPMGASGTKAQGTTGGANSRTLSVANLPAHSHPIVRKAGVGASSGVARGDGTSATSYDTDNTGSGTAVDTTPAYLAMHFIIRAKPII